MWQKQIRFQENWGLNIVRQAGQQPPAVIGPRTVPFLTKSLVKQGFWGLYIKDVLSHVPKILK